MTVYGYARVSTRQQSIDRQIRNILSYDAKATIYQEAFTGTVIARPEWVKLLKKVKSGDTIVFDSVSRMSRNAEEGIKQYFELYEKNVNLVFLNENYINTQTYKSALQNQISMTGEDVDLILEGVNRYLMKLAEKQIIIAFEQSQKEVDDNRQRTKGGIETRKRRNEEIKLLDPVNYEQNPDYKPIGQKQGAKLTTKKSITAKEIIKKHCKDFGGSLNDKECMELTGLARNTYYKYKREIKMEAVDEMMEALGRIKEEL